MNVRYRVELSQAERRGTDGDARAAANTPLASSSGRRFCWRPMGAAATRRLPGPSVLSLSTVGRTKRRFVEGNLERALSEEPRPGAERKLTGKEEALLVATACAKPPAGRKRWTLTLLADTMVKLTDHDSLSGETVRRRLAENDLKPWRRDMWCIPHVDGEYVARMEDVLDLYADNAGSRLAAGLLRRDPRPANRRGAPAGPGRTGTARALRLRVSAQRHRQSLRHLRSASGLAQRQGHRPARRVDYADCMRELVDVHYPDAACIRVVQDNLSIHKPGALYEAFAPAEARRILRRLEFHFTPKHASWLNMVECEIGVLQRQCLGRRIDDPKRLRNEIAAWQRRRNKTRARIKWMFTTDKARAKLGRAYPATAKESKSL